MDGGLPELTEELLKYLTDPDFANLPQAEQISQGKVLLHRLDQALKEQGANRQEAAEKTSRKLSSPELPQLIGEVVIAAAWAEDAGGTLVQATSDNWEVRAKGYDDTSSSLLKALKKVVPNELVERFDAAMKLRHFVVHGIFFDGISIKHQSSGNTYDVLAMKRSWRTAAPERELKAFTFNALRWLSQEFWEIEEELERIHSEVLFGKQNEEEN